MIEIFTTLDFCCSATNVRGTKSCTWLESSRWNLDPCDGIVLVMTDVTRILSEIEHGDPSAADQLLPLVYDELRWLAAARLKHEKPGQTYRRPHWFTRRMSGL